jgi:cell division control protein 6
MPVGIITEARALRPDTLPREIIRRHDEMQQLATALEPIVAGDMPETTLCYGPSGAGKTAVARRGVEKLKHEVLEVDSAYIESWDRRSAAVLRRVVDQVSRQPVQDNAGRDTLMEEIRDHERHIIVILDEMDQLAEYGVVHDLYQCRNTTLVGIVNRLEPLYHRLDGRIESRVRAAVEVHFDTYTDAELTDILEDRADWALAPNAVSKRTLREIARRADGDARRGVSMLRNAAKRASSEGYAEITIDLVDAVRDDAERDVREISLAKLGTDERRLYEALRGEGEVPVNDVYAVYREASDSDPSDRYIRTLRKRLVDYNLLEKLGGKRDRRYQALEP